MFKSIVNEIVKYYSYFEIENSRDKCSKFTTCTDSGKIELMDMTPITRSR